MLYAILVTALIMTALAIATRSRHSGGLISRHRYNNPYDAAAGAHEDHLDEL